MDEEAGPPGRRPGRRWLVRGRVQGVGFRASTRRKALSLGLSGHARNLPDGRVEVVAAGAPDAVAALRAWLEEGPSPARVEHVEDAGECPVAGSAFATE